MNFERQVDETEEHFIWRVYSYLKETGNITTRQAGDICNKELKLDYDESRHRKIYESFLKVWEHVKDEYITDDGILSQLDDIDERKDGLYKQQVKTSDALREYRKTLRNEARVDNIKAMFKDAYANSDEVVFEKYEEKHSGSKSSILMLSDFHVGLEINNYWNTYNKDVFECRIKSVVKKVIKNAKLLDIRTLYVVSLGDLISGSIHATTRLAEEMDTLDQVMYVAKTMKNLLIELSDFGLDIKYISVVGNHDRLNKVYKEHIEKESFNKLVDWYICDKIDDGIIKAEYIDNKIDEEISLFEINGKNCIAVHGHNDNVASVLDNMIQATRIIPDFIFMGHYHSKVTKTDGNATIFVNGSLVGVDEYAKTKRYFSKPAQSLIVFDDEDVIDIKLNL